MNVEINKTYYFNNRPVTVLREENEDFVFVAARFNIDHDVTGSCFCTPCMIGGYSTHRCEEAGEVIEAVMENIEDQDCFWVAKRYLQEHPFEYKECTQLQEQIVKLKETKKQVETSILTDEMYIQSLVNDKQEFEDELKRLADEITEYKELQQTLLEENHGLKENIQTITTVKNTNIVISADRMLELLKSETILNYLTAYGVDNWEGYGENFPDDIDSEVFEEFKAMSS